MNRDQAKIEAAIAEAAANPALAPKVLQDWYAPDIIEAIARLPRETAIAILHELPEETAIRIFNTPGLDRPSHLLEMAKGQASFCDWSIWQSEAAPRSAGR